jgi:hypothetical protein
VEEALRREHQIEAAVELAKKLKDWESLSVAVEAMIDHQTAVVAWWHEMVSVRHGLNRYNIDNADPGTLPIEDAEHRLGIAHQKISKWKKRFEDIEAYREFLRGPSYRTAMGESLIAGYSFARVRRLATVLACHLPPRAVYTPRAFSAPAISRRLVSPEAWISRTIGNAFAAN